MKRQILVLLILALVGCDTTDPQPPEEKPPGYQEDIYWPSLADSPWPMYRGNPQGTHSTKFPGPSSGIIEWINSDLKTTAGLSLGYSNDILSVSFYPEGIFKLNGDNGQIIWGFN